MSSSWCGVHFQKIAQISSLCNFHYTRQWKNSFPHAFLVINDLSATDLVHADFLPDLKKRTSQGPGVVGEKSWTDSIFVRSHNFHFLNVPYSWRINSGQSAICPLLFIDQITLLELILYTWEILLKVVYSFLSPNLIICESRQKLDGYSTRT